MIRPLFCLLLAASLSAQGGPGMGRGHFRSQLMNQLSQIRAQRIQQTLGIPHDQARDIAERWGRFDQELMERQRQIRHLRLQVNGVLLGPGSDDEKNARLRPLLAQFSSLRRQQHDLRLSFESEIMGSLPPVQQARLIILVEDLQKNLREAVRSGRRGE